jgi:cytochrome c-type biogenesis protein CcmE
LNKFKILAIVALPLIFVVLISGLFTSNISPYVSVTQLKGDNMVQKNIQVYGEVIVDTINYDRDSGMLTFDLTDGNSSVTIRHQGMVNNLQNSTEVVAIGEYGGDVFQADRVLVKCPSKYEAEARND